MTMIEQPMDEHGCSRGTQTVILAAGEGTRMRPLTATQPKPLLPVAGRPLVAHTMDAAAAAGAERFMIVVGYEAEQIREQFGDQYRGVPVEYATQTDAYGTADAVRAAANHLDHRPFVVLNGDDLYDEAAITALYEVGDGTAEPTPAVGAHQVINPEQYGVLNVSNGRVRGVTEKPVDPPSNLVNVGAYRFPAAALEMLDVCKSERGEYELTDVLTRVCERFDVRSVEVDR